MAAYVIMNVDVHDPAMYAEYMKRVVPSIVSSGGRFLARGGKTVVWEGAPQPKRIIVV